MTVGAVLLIRNKGLAVRAFYLGGICLMRTDLDLVQHAVVGCLGMILTLGNGAADALVCVHLSHLTFCDIVFIICRKSAVIPI